LNDSRLIEIYTRFLGVRGEVGEMYRLATYYDFLEHGSYLGIALPFVETATEHIRELANTVNEFCHYLHGLLAWGRVLDSVPEVDKFDAVIEFVLPISVYCLSAPYAIKGRLCTSIAELSHQANRFRVGAWTDNADLRKPNFLTARRHAHQWTSWPALESTLSRLNDDSFTCAVDDFRNRFNHGYPRRVEYGFTGFVRRNVSSDGSVSYGFGDSPPLRVTELIPVLAPQYSVAVECYEAYAELVREQQAVMITASRPPRR
jgi:hypothetical protein